MKEQGLVVAKIGAWLEGNCPHSVVVVVVVVVTAPQIKDPKRSRRVGLDSG
jgi:hypothetical protein